MAAVITTLTADELPRVLGLRAELHRHHSGLALPEGFAPRDEGDAVSGWRAKADKLLRGGDAELFVHTQSGADGPTDGLADGLALVCLRTSDEVMRPVLRPVGIHAELVTLVVLPAVRSTGLGARLHQVAADWARARGASTMHIETRAANMDGLRFYRRQGAAEAFVTMVQAL